MAITKKKTLKDRFILAPRNKWFVHTHKDAEDGWIGPSDTIGEAVLKAEDWLGDEHSSCFLAQGRKLKKWEIEDMEVDYDWEVETFEAFEVILLGSSMPTSATDPSLCDRETLAALYDAEETKSEAMAEACRESPRDMVAQALHAGFAAGMRFAAETVRGRPTTPSVAAAKLTYTERAG